MGAGATVEEYSMPLLSSRLMFFISWVEKKDMGGSNKVSDENVGEEEYEGTRRRKTKKDKREKEKERSRKEIIPKHTVKHPARRYKY